MNNQLSEYEEKVLNILNFKDDSNDIWTPVEELISKCQMNITELETALYLLQLRRIARISIDEVGSIKVTTEDKVNNKLSSRVDSVLGDMSEAEANAVEEENYEDAGKFRDWIAMGKDSSKRDELINKLLEDIESKED